MVANIPLLFYLLDCGDAFCLIVAQLLPFAAGFFDSGFRDDLTDSYY
jgi:hypothetical protein